MQSVKRITREIEGRTAWPAHWWSELPAAEAEATHRRIRECDDHLVVWADRSPSGSRPAQSAAVPRTSCRDRPMNKFSPEKTSCQRCGGQMRPSADVWGRTFDSCLSCGHEDYGDPDPKPPGGGREAGHNKI